MAKVSGIVTLDGQPVEGATVTFTPKGGGPTSFGITGTDGSFVMKTGSGRDGAAVAEHQVAVILSMVAGGTAAQAKPDDLAPAMSNEVGGGGAAKVIPPRTVWLVPEKYSKPESSGLTATVPSGGLSGHKIELTKK